MTNEELLAILAAYRRDSLGTDDSDLSVSRANSLDHYYGRPYGDEEDGKSKIVSKDLSETVDWIMPAIIEPLLASGDVVEFMAIGPEDEVGAKQETSYINHVLMSDNKGFLEIYDAIHDALLLKNGYWRHYWDDSEKETEEEYANLTMDRLTKLFFDLDTEGAEVDVLEQEQRESELGVLTDVKLRIKRKVNRVCVQAVPAEEVRVSKKCRGNLQDSPYVEWNPSGITRSDLIEMGMSKDFVWSLPSLQEEENDATVTSRNSITDETDDELGMMFDRSMDEIDYREAYVRVDFDGNGKAELRRVVIAGNRIPEGKEWNEVIDSIPMTSVEVKRIPHRHIGQSLDDELEDLQRIKTVLIRQMLDNIYSTNNPEKIVNKRVHLPDFLSTIPGGIKRVRDNEPVQGAFAETNIPPIADRLLPAITFMDAVKGSRTGINETTTATDPDVLKDSTKGAFTEGLRQASQKVRMILRMVAETGVKELMLRIHELLLKHQDIPRMIKLNGEYVPVNPSQWRERTDLKINVGLGTGSEEEKRANLMVVAQLQAGLAQSGLVTPDKSYQLFRDISATLGVLNPEKYALDPNSDEYLEMLQMQAQQPEQPNPLAEAEQVKGMMQAQIEDLKGQQKLALESLDQQHKAEMEMLKMQVESSEKERERQFKMQIEQMKLDSQEAQKEADLEIKALIEGLKADVQIQNKQQAEVKTFDPNTGSIL